MKRFARQRHFVQHELLDFQQLNQSIVQTELNNGCYPELEFLTAVLKGKCFIK